MFLCIYSDFGVLIYKGFEVFFFKKFYGPMNGLGFLELKLLYVCFVENFRGPVIKLFLIFKAFFFFLLRSEETNVQNLLKVFLDA